ncbi:MAG: hypothetical protein EZS28_050435 [Streblomastix strix]|uniref:Uncharacterized protein n=1 Tax=Streblomastix strix TaxID=222440 RepID=A0A5J4T766_9EUKA|nr:MAG: hypothetical protein EZS28_050435 [Streblomastix strix]
MTPEEKQVYQSPYPKGPFGDQKLEPKPTILTTLHPSRSGEKRQMQTQLLKSCIQNVYKATKSEQDPRKRNKDPTPRTSQRQCLTPRLTSRNSWTDQGRKEERREGRVHENRETDNDIEKILEKNGGTDSKIFGIMGNIYNERFHLIRIHPPIGKQPEYLQATTLAKDNEIHGIGR